MKQIITGSFPVVRFEVVDLIRTHHLTPNELGYFIIFLTSADWDIDRYRHGYIRQGLHTLAILWNIPLSTLSDNLKKLIGKQVIMLGAKKMPVIIDFDKYTQSGSSSLARIRYSNDYVEKYFENSFPKSENPFSENEIPLIPKPILPASFKSSFKNDLRATSDSGNTTKMVRVGNTVRSDAEYDQIYKSGNWGQFTPDDMKWVDQNTKWNIEINDQNHENDIVDTFFDGDIQKYKNCLINQ